MCHQELDCKGLLCEENQPSTGLHFVFGCREDGTQESLSSLKQPNSIIGHLKYDESIVKDKTTIEEAIYLIIAVHSIVGIPFESGCHDFLTYLRSCFMGGPSEKLTSKILSFKKAVPLPNY